MSEFSPVHVIAGPHFAPATVRPVHAISLDAISGPAWLVHDDDGVPQVANQSAVRYCLGFRCPVAGCATSGLHPCKRCGEPTTAFYWCTACSTAEPARYALVSQHLGEYHDADGPALGCPLCAEEAMQAAAAR